MAVSSVRKTASSEPLPRQPGYQTPSPDPWLCVPASRRVCLIGWGRSANFLYPARFPELEKATLPIPQPITCIGPPLDRGCQVSNCSAHKQLAEDDTRVPLRQRGSERRSIDRTDPEPPARAIRGNSPPEARLSALASGGECTRTYSSVPGTGEYSPPESIESGLDGLKIVPGSPSFWLLLVMRPSLPEPTPSRSDRI